jgi:hypothetical protein
VVKVVGLCNFYFIYSSIAFLVGTNNEFGPRFLGLRLEPDRWLIGSYLVIREATNYRSSVAVTPGNETALSGFCTLAI